MRHDTPDSISIVQSGAARTVPVEVGFGSVRDLYGVR